MKNYEYEGNCDLCGRFATTLSEHHLIPRTTHSNSRVRKMFSREEMATRKSDFCHPCHHACHAFFSNKTLALERNTVSLLREHPLVRGHIKWVRGQKPEFKSRGGKKPWGERR